MQAAGENRIASASGLHPVILGLSDSLQGASLNQGNFTSARRLTADKTLRPLWGGLAGALQTIIPTPGGSRLWYDDRHIPFLADDVKDAAEVRQMNTSAMRQLIDGGFEPDSVVDFITSGDYKRLKHSGLTSVQLLPPGTVADNPAPEEPPPPTDNGNNGDNGRSMLQLAHYALSQQRQQPVTFEEGAFRIETPVTVESPQITFPEGFMRSETTIEPARVTIEEGAVKIDSPITVEPAQLTIEDGAIRSEVNPGDVHIDASLPDGMEMPQILDEALVTRLEKALAPKTRHIVRDEQGRMVSVIEE